MSCHPSTHDMGIQTNFPMEHIPGPPKGERPKKDRTMKVDYALPADFCKAFHDHLDDFYTLSLLLTADPQKAEQCVVSGLEDCLQGNPVFREWAQSWARRTVIKNAIRVISPSAIPPARNERETTAAIHEPLLDADAPIAAITSLQPFDRFAYVLTVLERYSDGECSILLDCKVEKVIAARIRALQRLGRVGSSTDPAESALTKGAA